MTNFRLFQTERICRHQFQKKGQKVLQTAKNAGKREIARNKQFCSLSHIIFKRRVLQRCKNQSLFGKEVRIDTVQMIFDF